MADHFKTSWLRAVPFSKVATMVRSAVAVAIPWLDARLGPVALVVLLPRLSGLDSRDIPSCCDGAWAAIATLLVKAGG